MMSQTRTKAFYSEAGGQGLQMGTNSLISNNGNGGGQVKGKPGPGAGGYHQK